MNSVPQWTQSSALSFTHATLSPGILFSRHSSSRSRSPSPVNAATFITSFGGDSSDDEAVIQGPALPPHLQIKSSMDSSSTKSLKRSSLSRSVSLRFYSCQKVLSVVSVTHCVPIALCIEHLLKTKQKKNEIGLVACYV